MYSADMMRMLNSPRLVWLCVSLLIVAVLCGRATGAETGSEPTSSWVVQIRGGSSEADRLAEEHGFKNKGQVRSPLVCDITCRTKLMAFIQVYTVPFLASLQK